LLLFPLLTIYHQPRLSEGLPNSFFTKFPEESLSGSFRSQEECNSGKDPCLFIGVLTLHRNIEHGDEIGLSTSSSEVNRAIVHSNSDALPLAD